MSTYHSRFCQSSENAFERISQVISSILFTIVLLAENKE